MKQNQLKVKIKENILDVLNKKYLSIKTDHIKKSKYASLSFNSIDNLED